MRRRRPGAGRDRRGHAGSVEKEVETAIAPYRALADDPRRARLPGRHPRPAAAQAHRPLLLRAGAADRAGLPARDDAARRRVLPQRRLPVRGRHRPPAGPVRDGAGVRTTARSSRSCRRSATTTTSAARCPGSMPSHARSVFEEGLMVPPIKLWDQGVPNEAALRIMTRNSRMPDSLAGRPGRRVLGLPDGRAAARASCSTGTAARRSRPASTRSSTRPPRRSAGRSCPRSPTAPTSGRTTPSTTASTRRGCTPSGSP